MAAEAVPHLASHVLCLNSEVQAVELGFQAVHMARSPGGSAGERDVLCSAKAPARRRRLAFLRSAGESHSGQRPLAQSLA